MSSTSYTVEKIPVSQLQVDPRVQRDGLNTNKVGDRFTATIAESGLNSEVLAQLLRDRYGAEVSLRPMYDPTSARVRV